MSQSGHHHPSPSPLVGCGPAEACPGDRPGPHGLGRGGRSTAQQLSALRNAKQMRRNPTDIEHRLWQILRARRLGGWKFRRQVCVGTYIVDFVCHAAKLIVEVDGGHHCVERDGGRDLWLESQGFHILRFWNNDIFENEEGVLSAILLRLEASADRSPLPNPSPTRGEGH